MDIRDNVNVDDVEDIPTSLTSYILDRLYLTIVFSYFVLRVFDYLRNVYRIYKTADSMTDFLF